MVRSPSARGFEAAAVLLVALLTGCASSKDTARTSTPGAETAARSDSGAGGGAADTLGETTAELLGLTGADTAAVSLGTATDTASTLDAAGAARRPVREPDVIYVPTPDTVVVEMLRLARVDDDDLVYDLGSGDGRIVVAAAKRFGARGVGVDIDPQRVAEANANARRAGVTGRVKFIEGDLFETDIGDATAVTLYLLPDLNVKLRPILLRDLPPGTPVVSHAFDMAEWTPDSSLTIDGRTVHLWIIPADAAGTWTWTDAEGTPKRRYQLTLQQRFQNLTGSLQADGDAYAVSDLRLRGDSLSITATGSGPRGAETLRFVGRVAGDTIKGTVRGSGASDTPRPWRAERTAAGSLLE